MKGSRAELRRPGPGRFADQGGPPQRPERSTVARVAALVALLLTLVGTGGFAQRMVGGGGGEDEPPGKAIIYPGGVRIFSPYARSSLALQPGSGVGGRLEGGLAYSPAALSGDALRLGAGYGYEPAGEADSVQIPFAGLHWEQSLGGTLPLPLMPRAGLNVALPIAAFEPTVGVELVAEVGTQLHLHSRSFLTLHAGLTVPLMPNRRLSFFLGFGIRRAHPRLVPVPPVSLDVDLEPERFSPDGDGRGDTLNLRITTGERESVERWRLRIYDERGAPFYSESGSGAPPEVVRWNGRSEEGELVSSASRYRVEVAVVDTLGREAAHVSHFLVDILVISEDGRLKIRIPSITFPPAAAEFELLSAEEAIETNRRILEELAEIFDTFPEYRIVIEGHANAEFYADPRRAEREQREVLLPLSRERAREVKERLVELGIEGKRLRTRGVGAADPVVPFSDEEHRWKNRRVEFILLRPERPRPAEEAR